MTGWKNPCTCRRHRVVHVQGGVVRHPDDLQIHAGGQRADEEPPIQQVAEEVVRKRIVIAPVSTRETDLLTDGADIGDSKVQP